MQPISVFWFRRDLRLYDNTGLLNALRSSNPVVCLFIFDLDILQSLENKNDARVEFIHNCLVELNRQLNIFNSSLLVKTGKPIEVFQRLIKEYKVETVFTNEDYEPYAIERDMKVNDLLKFNGIEFKRFKDQVIFAKDEIISSENKPYTKFSPFARKWRSLLSPDHYKIDRTLGAKNFITNSGNQIPSLKSIGFERSGIDFPSIEMNDGLFKDYHELRNIPSVKGTSRLGIHLRFGTISIRQLVKLALNKSESFLNELIWREFFMQLLWHFPYIVNSCFRKEYNNIQWVNNEQQFLFWCEGNTGYPIVDAGMRELNKTGFMHNRVRMITASFLVKHLLVDWQWGEAYFAEKLLDYELASNNGNWQWIAGCGADYAPYFRIFNPIIQAKKFDPDQRYIKEWIPEYNTDVYPPPIIEHEYARQRCLRVFKQSIQPNVNNLGF